MKNWVKDDYYVSFYNFEKNVTRGLKFPRKIIFHDVTLRDGEQQAGIIFRKDDKIKIARALDEAGVDRIEAGMPSVSKEDMETIKEIAHLGLQAKIYGFARCMKEDVNNALKADVDGVVMEIPSSDHLLKYGYGWTEGKAIERSVEATSYAHEHGLKVAFFTIDSTRATFNVFWRLVGSVATKGHMDSLVVADTFGVMNPQAYAHFIQKIKKKTRKPIEVHAHNDFGLGVANTITALASGADVAHVTINGIGERSGNASLEEVAAALKMMYGLKINLKFEKFRTLSKLVQELSGVTVPPPETHSRRRPVHHRIRHHRRLVEPARNRRKTVRNVPLPTRNRRTHPRPGHPGKEKRKRLNHLQSEKTQHPNSRKTNRPHPVKNQRRIHI